MIDKSIYKEFYNFLTEGANQVVQLNRDNLESFIEESIDINKATDIINKHRKNGDNFVVSQETFLSISLVDNIPLKVDFRFTPEFKLDGIIFKNYIGKTKRIISTKVPYSTKVSNFLRSQLNPDSEVEMEKSVKYTNNIVSNLELFDKIYRIETDSFIISTQTAITKLINTPSIAITNIVRCIDNKDKYYFNIYDNKRVYSATSSWYLETVSHQLEFCIAFNKYVTEQKTVPTQDEVNQAVFHIVLKKQFPKLSDKQIKTITSHSLNMDKVVNYDSIRKTISKKHYIDPTFTEYIEDCKDKKTVSKESFIIAEYYTVNENILNLMTRTKYLYAVNNHNFFNLVYLIDSYRYYVDLNNRKKRVVAPFFSYCKLQPFCDNIISLSKLNLVVKERRVGLLKDLHVNFFECLQNMSFYSEIKDREVSNPVKFKRRIVEKFIKYLNPSITIFKTVKKRYVIDDNYDRVYSDKFLEAVKNNIEVVNFINEQSAWDINNHDNTLHEITSGLNLTNIKNIGVSNVLNFLFKEQAGDGYFNNVQNVLFHENAIIIKKGNEITSLSPSDGYKQFVLKKIGVKAEVSTIEDYGDVQLNRFIKILNEVILKKGKKNFETQNETELINSLSGDIKIKFIDTVDSIKNGEPINHKISLGTISNHEKQIFSDFLSNLYFIFPSLISEIHISASLVKNRNEIPSDDKELMFYIEKQRNDRDMDTKYTITQEDIIILNRSNRFYTTILIERALCVIFNQEILHDLSKYAEFKSVIGGRGIELAKRHFGIRGQDITDARLMRKLFLQNCMLFIQNKKTQLSPQVINFIENIFVQSKQLN